MINNNPPLRKRYSGIFHHHQLAPLGSGFQVTALLNEVIDLTTGKEFADHSWVQSADRIKDLDLTMGDKIEFEATCKPYYSTGEKKTKLGLRNPTNIEIVNPPAFRPQIEIEEEQFEELMEEKPKAAEMVLIAVPPQQPQPPAKIVAETVVVAIATPTSPLDTIRKIKALAREVGGVDVLAEYLRELQS